MGIGANLPAPDGTPPRAACEGAVAALRTLASDGRITRARWWSSAPVPRSDQPRFVNGVARFDTLLGPARMLAALHAIEAGYGRTRGVANAARTLDLDLLDHGGEVSDDPRLTLPHPRLGARLFVLLPLRDVAPDWTCPRTGRSIAALIAALDPQDVAPL